MKGFGLIKHAVVIATLCAFGFPQAEAIEIVGGPSPAAHMSDDLLTQVRRRAAAIVMAGVATVAGEACIGGGRHAPGRHARPGGAHAGRRERCTGEHPSTSTGT